MSDELRALRLRKQIPASAIVLAVQKTHPSFDKTQLSKCEHGDKYGVTIRRDVMDALIEEFAPEAKAAIKKRRAGGHRLTNRISCRLEEEDYTALQQIIKTDGYSTIQDWLADVVKQRITDHKLKGVFDRE